MNDDLWMVQAVIQPFRLDAASLALQEVPGFGGITVSQSRGYGRGMLNPPGAPRPGNAARKAAEDAVDDFAESVRVEIAVAGLATAELVVEAIKRAAHTGNRGDGRIFVWPLTRAVRIRSFEQGASAL